VREEIIGEGGGWCGTRLTIARKAGVRNRREIGAVNKRGRKRAACCASYQDSGRKTREWKSQFHNGRGGGDRMEDRNGKCGNGITSCGTWSNERCRDMEYSMP